MKQIVEYARLPVPGTTQLMHVGDDAEIPIGPSENRRLAYAGAAAGLAALLGLGRFGVAIAALGVFTATRPR